MFRPVAGGIKQNIFYRLFIYTSTFIPQTMSEHVWSGCIFIPRTMSELVRADCILHRDWIS